jgi:hypothetical protein
MSATSTKNKIDDNVYFAGVGLKKPEFTFDKCYILDWDYKSRYYYPHEWRVIKKKQNRY